ncbi:MAG: pitrilysin family protein [Wenzhouxiangellaceae bacterium]|nr:pitrilysin family protein [Wenzhouxiangellaceae bacterium]
MMKMRYRFAGAALIALVASFGWAQEGATAGNATLVTQVEGISEYRLDNGMKVLLMPDQSRPTTTINVTYFVGSKHESYGESGMAHLLEHLVFMGTPDHADIKKEISERGGFANGSTWWERTNYFQTLPAGEENLEWAIEMEADRMVNSFIAKEDLESEMTVVRNEFEIGENNPFRVLLQRVMATAYEWHGYGRSTIGARADLENVPIERLQNFYRTYYQPDNAMIVLSGNFEPGRALELIEQHFGAIPKPERSLDNRLWDTYTREPYQDGPREVTVRRSGNVPTLMAAYHVPSVLDEDFAAVEALSFVLGDTPSGRLYKALVEPGIASEVGSIVFRLPEPSLLLVYANLPEGGDLARAREVTLAALDDLEANPPTEEEVRRAVNALTSRMAQTLNDSNRVGITLSEWAASGDWRLLFLHRDRIEQVTTDDVRAAAETFIVRDNRTIGRFVPDDDPERAIIEPAPDPETLLADYTGREQRAAGEEFAATPENIEARVQRFTLSNGTEVALLPKGTRGNRVRGSMTMRIGNLAALTGKGAVPQAVAAMLDRGTKNYTRQQIADRIDELQAGVNLSGSNEVTATIEVTRENLAPLVDLIAEIAKNPTFPEAELDEYKNQALTRIAQQSDDPAGVASRMINRHMNPDPPDHPRYTPTFDEEKQRIESLTAAQLRDFHARFYGFGPATTIAFVGDFDAAALREQLERHFGGWTAGVEYAHVPDPHEDRPAARMVEQIDDKANAVLIGTESFPMPDTHEDYPALQLAGYMLGGGFLNSRLSDRIRNEEGLSYAVGGNFNASAEDENGGFFAFAMFAPENRDRLEEVLDEELAKAVEEGFTKDELESGRKGFLEQQQLIRSDDGRLAGLLSTGLYLDRDLYFQAEREKRLAELTLEEVNAAVAKWLDPDAMSYAIAGDFTADEAEAAEGEGPSDE